MTRRHATAWSPLWLVIAIFLLGISAIGVRAAEAVAPAPLLKEGQAVDWWFVFKFNAATFPGCGGEAKPVCIFGGRPQSYTLGQQFVYASSEDHSLQKGSGCAGDTVSDPLGATFAQIYDNDYYYVVWNDQFYDDPKISGCTASCSSPWGHSKGVIAWNDSGSGLVMQVTTPSWPASGSKRSPRKADGNTLGCVEDNDVKVSQHFFSLRLTKDDTVKVLKGLQNASVVTKIDDHDQQVVRNGGPSEIQDLVRQLGRKSSSDTVVREKLSSGVELISKPSHLHVPPWQLVSSLLDGVSLRTATWWANPKIYTTTASSAIKCWRSDLESAGSVEIATTGQWQGKAIGLTGGPGTNNNHAKIGVSTSRGHDYTIFGDMNQQGTLSGNNCASSQNGRGGLFYVIDDKTLADGIRSLLKGSTAPSRAP